MSNFEGFATAAAQIGLTSILIKPKRGMFSPSLNDGTLLPDIIAHAVIEESHIDRLEVTEHPVEQGASISDHAFKQPAFVSLLMGWSNSPSDNSLISSAVGAAAAVSPTGAAGAGVLGVGVAVQSLISGAGVGQVKAAYQSLLQMQALRAIFTLYTGKRIYNNMICKTIATTTDYNSENSLIISMECQEIIIVNTNLVSLSKNSQKFPKETTSPHQ